MGNAQGLKIKNFENNEIIKDIKLNENQSIIPYVHFITKLNRFQVENFPKNHLIREFTVVNFITEKQNVIHIDSMEAGFFFKGLEYSYESIPERTEFILITNILDNSASHGTNIKPNYTLLLGDEDKYFDSPENIAESLKAKKFKFLFFDITESKTFFVDYTQKLSAKLSMQNKNSDEANKISLGIECGIISRLRLLKLIDKIQKEQIQNKNNLNTFISNENISLFTNKESKENIFNNEETNLTQKTIISTEEKSETNNYTVDKILIDNEKEKNVLEDKTDQKQFENNNVNNNNEIKQEQSIEGKFEENEINEKQLNNYNEKLIQVNQNDLIVIQKDENEKICKEIIKNNKFDESETLDEDFKDELFSKQIKLSNKSEVISNLLNEREIISENKEICKDKNLKENKIDDLQANSAEETSAVKTDKESINEIKHLNIKNELNKSDFKANEEETCTKIQHDNLPFNEERISKSQNDKVNIIINKNVINLSNRKIEQKYMKHLLVYDFIDPKTNYVDFLKNSSNEKIVEKYAKQINSVKK